MDDKGKALLRLMFRPEEQICISPNKYGYCSIPLDKAFSDRVTLVSTKHRDGAPIEECLETYPGESLQLVALNPIMGYRSDANVTAYRSFLIELDGDLLINQLNYVEDSGMPYSAVIFSGNKSLHFLITLTEDLSNKKAYDYVIEWILRIMYKADQATKNPSRSIRVPGAIRNGKKQSLVKMKDRVSPEDLQKWLNRYPQAKPKVVTPRPKNNLKSFPSMRPWMQKALREGLDPSKGRNVQWFAIAVELFMNGFSEEEVIEELEGYFEEERDFKRREWITSIKSAGKYVSERK